MRLLYCSPLELAVEADELLIGVLSDLKVTINYFPNGKDPILTIFYYVEAHFNWRGFTKVFHTFDDNIDDFDTSLVHVYFHVEGFFEFTIGFCRGYLHNDGAILLFYLDNRQTKRELFCFFTKNKLKMKDKWIVLNSLHLTYLMNVAK